MSLNFDNYNYSTWHMAVWNVYQERRKCIIKNDKKRKESLKICSLWRVYLQGQTMFSNSLCHFSVEQVLVWTTSKSSLGKSLDNLVNRPTLRSEDMSCCHFFLLLYRGVRGNDYRWVFCFKWHKVWTVLPNKNMS